MYRSGVPSGILKVTTGGGKGGGGRGQAPRAALCRDGIYLGENMEF